MRFMNRCREIEYVEFSRHIFKKLLQEEKEWIVGHCDEKLEEYYKKRLLNDSIVILPAVSVEF